MHQLFLLLTIFITCFSNAEPTTDSALRCQPTEVVANQNITCFIYVLDELQEPTTIFSLDDFLVQATSQLEGVTIFVGEKFITADPTVIQFVISATSGTVINVAVSLQKSYIPIRDSGQVISVLGSVERLGALKCDQGQLPLRSTVQCISPVYGAQGIPALVRVQDLFFSEDHNTGTFMVIRGNGQLIFNFTAPPSLPMNFSKFRLRVSLVGSSQFLHASFPVLYPRLPPTSRTVLKCIDGFPLLCFVNSADNVGPVMFFPSQYKVVFERESTYSKSTENENSDNNIVWAPFTDGMLTNWRPSTAGSATEILNFRVKVPNEVFQIRLRVFTRKMASSSGGRKGSGDEFSEEVVGSPFVFMSGIPPTPEESSFRVCTKMFMKSYDTIQCTVDVAPNTMADPHYFSIRASLAGARVEDIRYGKDSSREESSMGPKASSVIYFSYTAPLVKKREAETIFITIGSESVARSPVRLVIYPQTSSYEESMSGEGGEHDSRHKVSVLGFSFFGLVVGIALVVYCFQTHSKMMKDKEKRGSHTVEDDATVGSEMGSVRADDDSPGALSLTPSECWSMESPNTRSALGTSVHMAAPPTKKAVPMQASLLKRVVALGKKDNSEEGIENKSAGTTMVYHTPEKNEQEMTEMKKE